MMQARSISGTALGWIREDLDKQLHKIRLQVENIANNPLAGELALSSANEDIEQLRLTFETLMLNGAEQVMEEMFRLCGELIEEDVEDRNEAMAVLMDALVVLPAYLDRLQSGHQDLPVILLPLINRMRSARGEEALTEGTLFAPLLDVELPELEFIRRPGYDEPFDYFAQRMRRQYEMALQNWIQDQADLSLLSPLQGICETLRHRLQRYDLKRLWWVATEVVEGLMDGHADNDVSLRRLLARLHLLLQALTEGGEDAIGSGTTTSVTQALLFHVAKARPGSPGLDLVRQRFELNRLMPDRDALMRARGTLSGRDREMFKSLSAAVQDELSLVKDALDLELRTGQVEPERREQILEALGRLSDTLGMLGLTQQASSMNKLLPGFEASAKADRASRETELVKLAERLVMVESALNEQIETLGEPIDGGGDEQSFITLPGHEQRRIRSRLLDEAIISLHQSEDAIRKRFSGDNSADPGTPLDEVSGALLLIEDEDAARLSSELGDALRLQLHRAYSESALLPQDLEALTDAMAALELYLAARRDCQQDGDRFMEILADRLMKLAASKGKEVEPEPAISAPGSAARPPVAAVPSPSPEVPGEAVAESGTGPLAVGAEPPAAEIADADADELPAAIDPELREIFLEEYETVLESLQSAIPEWMANLENVEALTTIRRAFHTLKGSGRMVGAEELGDFSWRVEDMLNALLEGRVENFADISAMVRLAQATLPSLRQRLLQQEVGVQRSVIEKIGQQAQGLAGGRSADWEMLRDILPAYLAGMLPGAIKPGLAELETAEEAGEEHRLLRDELKQNLEPIQAMLELISRDRSTRVSEEQVRAMHTIAGALAMYPEGRDEEVARAFEAVLTAQSGSGQRFSNDSIWTLVSAAGHIQSRLDRLQGQAHAEAPGDPGDLIAHLENLAEELAEPVAAAPPADSDLTPETMEFDPGRSVFAADRQPAEQDLEAELEAELEHAFIEDEQPAPDTTPGDIPESQLDRELVPIFLDEAREVLERADSLLNQWRKDLHQLELVQHLQREIHTFKGGARMAGLAALGEYSHAMESLLERIAGRRLTPSVSAVQVLEEGCDRLQGWVEKVAADDLPDATRALELLLQQIQALEDVTGQAESVAVRSATEKDRTVQDLPDAPPRPALPLDQGSANQIRVDSDLLDSLINASGEVNIFRSRLDQQVSNLRSNLREFDETMTRLREQFRKLDIEIETQIRSNYQTTTTSGDSSFDPLELDEFSSLHQLSRSLSETVSDLLNLHEMLDDNTRKSEQMLLQQSRVSTELQEGLMKTRMVPFGSIATRLRRLVRSVAKESGKQARLQLRRVGNSDELDRNVLEHITAPLEHMIRNAIVHGIESPAERRDRGKGEEGEITVTVESEATEFVIRIADDGAGIDLEAIRTQAIERGLLEPDAEARRQQLYEFILDSGFTTSSEVTRLAGRGVGMDVVSSEIKQIGGSLEIESEPGQGTQFTIRIPFTLAVMQSIGMIAGQQRYLLPLSSVVGVSRMLPNDYEALVEDENPVYSFAGQDYPLLDLELLLGEPSRPTRRDNVSLLILSAGDQKAALKVPELLPHREVVIKPVGPQISCVPGILGGSISANGEVIVILDPGPLIRHALIHGVSHAVPTETELALPGRRVAMIVDDSITMRKVTTRVLEGHDFEVMTARDGVDAIEQLQDRRPDIILLDIEMPRMDGYEMAQHVREDTRLRDIPIIMITSRAGQKHRDRAEQVGANAYLTKPYSEADLIEEVHRLLPEDGDRRG